MACPGSPRSNQRLLGESSANTSGYEFMIDMAFEETPVSWCSCTTESTSLTDDSADGPDSSSSGDETPPSISSNCSCDGHAKRDYENECIQTRVNTKDNGCKNCNNINTHDRRGGDLSNGKSKSALCSGCNKKGKHNKHASLTEPSTVDIIGQLKVVQNSVRKMEKENNDLKDKVGKIRKESEELSKKYRTLRNIIIVAIITIFLGIVASVIVSVTLPGRDTSDMGDGTFCLSCDHLTAHLDEGSWADVIKRNKNCCMQDMNKFFLTVIKVLEKKIEIAKDQVFQRPISMSRQMHTGLIGLVHKATKSKSFIHAESKRILEDALNSGEDYMLRWSEKDTTRRGNLTLANSTYIHVTKTGYYRVYGEVRAHKDNFKDENNRYLSIQYCLKRKRRALECIKTVRGPSPVMDKKVRGVVAFDTTLEFREGDFIAIVVPKATLQILASRGSSHVLGITEL